MTIHYNGKPTLCEAMFLSYIKSQFPDRNLLYWPITQEETSDPTRLKRGLCIINAPRDYDEDGTWLDILQAHLLYRKRHRISRDPIRYKWESRAIKDPSWHEDMLIFSKNHRRGTKITTPRGVLTILDVSRDNYTAKKHGYNNLYKIRLDHE